MKYQRPHVKKVSVGEVWRVKISIGINAWPEIPKPKGYSDYIGLDKGSHVLILGINIIEHHDRYVKILAKGRVGYLRSADFFHFTRARSHDSI